MNYKKFVTFVLLFTFVFALPVSINAQGVIPETFVPVPVSDAAVRTKEVGITIFGFTVPGLTLDLVAITIAKAVIETIVNSTVDWINSGFEGGPAFVTDPKQYFTDIADNIAGDFIAGSDLSVLCSPFQTQVRLALQNNYNRQDDQFQCTLTDVVGNIEAFYGDFSQGGWDGWFSMTQNSANNPYGSYLDAQTELDSRIAERLGIEQTQLNWGKGFLSFKKCAGTEVLNQTTGQKECIGKTEIVTPGTAIEGQLEGVLGTGVRQLELADELDEIVGALAKQLLQKAIFSATGLLK